LVTFSLVSSSLFLLLLVIELHMGGRRSEFCTIHFAFQCVQKKLLKFLVIIILFPFHFTPLHKKNHKHFSLTSQLLSLLKTCTRTQNFFLWQPNLQPENTNRANNTTVGYFYHRVGEKNSLEKNMKNQYSKRKVKITCKSPWKTYTYSHVHNKEQSYFLFPEYRMWKMKQIPVYLQTFYRLQFAWVIWLSLSFL